MHKLFQDSNVQCTLYQLLSDGTCTLFQMLFLCVLFFNNIFLFLKEFNIGTTTHIVIATTNRQEVKDDKGYGKFIGSKPRA